MAQRVVGEHARGGDDKPASSRDPCPRRARSVGSLRAMDDDFDNGLAAALHAGGPDPELADELMLFGRFVGSWDILWLGRNEASEPIGRHGELRFGWVLGG